MAPSPAPQAPKAKPKRKVAGKTDGGYKIAGTVVPWDPDIDLDRPTPTPLFPVRQDKNPQSHSITQRSANTVAPSAIQPLYTSPP